MKDQDTEDRTNHHLLLKTHTDADLFLNSAGIDDVLRGLCTFFSGRVNIADREMLSFCLRHVFYNVNQMYTLLLPELTKCSLGKASTEQKRLRIHTMPMRNMPVQNLMIQYSIWSLLQEIEAILERLESLCQLVTGATTNMLNELDRTCSIKSMIQQPAENSNRPAIDSTLESQVLDSDQSQTQQADSNEWQWKLAQMREKTRTWLKSYETQLPLSIQFAILEPMIPTLSQIDAAFTLLLKSACTIFGDILPDFRESGTNEDEKATTLLLDITQRCDQIVLQIGVLAEPLHVLTGQYTLETTMQ